MIVCNGDSNTQSNSRSGWAEQLGSLIGTTIINRGVGASTIVDHTTMVFGVPLWGGYYIANQLANVDPFESLANASGTPGTFFGQPVWTPFPTPDLMVLAFGTNDITNYTPAQIVSAYKKYRRRAIAEGVTVYIATTPPRFDTNGTLSSCDAAIRALNQKIRGNWPGRYIEFYDGFTFDDFQADGLHLTAAGQAKRAVAAAAVIQGTQ